jgi:hypothetical protein
LWAVWTVRLSSARRSGSVNGRLTCIEPIHPRAAPTSPPVEAEDETHRPPQESFTVPPGTGRDHDRA